MKTLVIALTAMIGVTLVHAQPRLEVVGGTKLDFGEISRGKKIDHTVTLKNIGSQTLVLGKVEASCGCTGALMSDTNIEPGKTGTMVISFNSQNFSGPVHKTVTVNSNDAEAPRTVIEFRGNVFQEVTLEPQHFWFKDAEVGRTNIATIVVKNSGKQKLEVTGFRTQLEGFTLKLPPDPIEPGGSTNIIAQYTPKESKKVLSDGVFIKTSSPAQPEMYVQIYGVVKEFIFK